jgi:hypothetical protein
MTLPEHLYGARSWTGLHAPGRLLKRTAPECQGPRRASTSGPCLTLPIGFLGPASYSVYGVRGAFDLPGLGRVLILQLPVSVRL